MAKNPGGDPREYHASFRRIRVTPTASGDVVGTMVVAPRNRRLPQERPLFAHSVWRTRSTARRQGAVRADGAMQERKVTIGGHAYPLPEPSRVATQNRPSRRALSVPEAQLERLFQGEGRGTSGRGGEVCAMSGGIVPAAGARFGRQSSAGRRSRASTDRSGDTSSTWCGHPRDRERRATGVAPLIALAVSRASSRRKGRRLAFLQGARRRTENSALAGCARHRLVRGRGGAEDGVETHRSDSRPSRPVGGQWER